MDSTSIVSLSKCLQYFRINIIGDGRGLYDDVSEFHFFWKSRHFAFTEEVTDRFKGLDLTDNILEKLWMEVRYTVQEAVVKTIPKKKKFKMVVCRGLTNSWEKKRSKRPRRKRMIHPSEYRVQRIARRDKKAFLSDFGGQEDKIFHCFHYFPFYLPWLDLVGRMSEELRMKVSNIIQEWWWKPSPRKRNPRREMVV